MVLSWSSCHASHDEFGAPIISASSQEHVSLYSGYGLALEQNMAHNGNEKTSPRSDTIEYAHNESRKHSILSIGNVRHDELNAVFENPLARVPDEQLMRDVEDFCERHGMMEHVEDMKKGALISKAPDEVQTATFLSDQEKETILREKTHKWDHPWMLYWLCGKHLTCVDDV